MNLKTGALLLLVGSMGLLAAGCGPQEKWGQDQKLQAELFFKCLKHIPKGPLASKYNDWDEVVSECGSQARLMSWKCVKNCS